MIESADGFVLDSFALLSHFEDEPGAARVRAVLTDAAASGTRTAAGKLYISRINVGELIYITEREQGLAAAQTVLNAIQQLPIEILEATRDRVHQAAHIKAHHALSYADAFAVGAAQEMSAVLLTGDPEFASVAKLVSIEWLMRR